MGSTRLLAIVGKMSRSKTRSGLWVNSTARASVSPSASLHIASQTRPMSLGKTFQQKRLDMPPSTATLSVLRQQKGLGSKKAYKAGLCFKTDCSFHSSFQSEYR